MAYFFSLLIQNDNYKPVFIKVILSMTGYMLCYGICNKSHFRIHILNGFKHTVNDSYDCIILVSHKVSLKVLILQNVWINLFIKYKYNLAHLLYYFK